MKKFLRILLISLTVITAVSVQTNQVFASDVTPDFSVSTIPNKYQSKGKGYFDLAGLKQGQKTTLKLKLYNSSDKAAIFDVSVNDAVTNANLILDYTHQNLSKKAISGLKLSDYVFAKKSQVTILPHSNVVISFKVTAPANHFDGQIVGGIYLKKHITKNQKGTKNSFGYVNTVVLRNGKQSMQAKPRIKSAKYTSKDNVATVIGIVNNPIQAFATGMNVKQFITDQKGNVIQNLKSSGRTVAPTSQTNVYFKLEKSLHSGNYYYNFEFENNGDVVKSSAPFTVSKSDAVVVNAQGINLTMWLFIILMVIIVFLLLFLFFTKRRRRQQEQESNLN